jgi:hypothetical protein
MYLSIHDPIASRLAAQAAPSPSATRGNRPRRLRLLHAEATPYNRFACLCQCQCVSQVCDKLRLLRGSSLVSPVKYRQLVLLLGAHWSRSAARGQGLQAARLAAGQSAESPPLESTGGRTVVIWWTSGCHARTPPTAIFSSLSDRAVHLAYWGDRVLVASTPKLDSNQHGARHSQRVSGAGVIRTGSYW